MLNDEEYKKELIKKLSEEVQEYKIDKNIDELADILEVIYALAILHDCTPKQLEEIRVEKAKKRGSFNKKIFLIEVED